jgi:ATP-binding cassette subfamily B protein
MTAPAASTLSFKEYSRRFALPMWGWYAGGFVLLAAVNLVNLQIPQLAKSVINDLTAGADLTNSRGVALAVIGLGFLMIVIRSLSRIVIFWPGRRLETATKSMLFGRILTLTEEFFLRHGMGDLISRLSNDVGQLRAFFAFGLLQFLNVIFLLVFTLAKMASVHLTLTLLSLVPLAVMFIIMRVAMPRLHVYSRENQNALGALTNRVTEAFVNVHVIQANAAVESFTARAETENDEVFRTNMKMVYIRMLIFPLMTCLAGMSQLVVLGYGGYEVIAGRLSVGDILAFNVYIGLLTFPLSAMGMILSLYQRAKTALERIGEIDRARPEGVVVAAATAEAAGRVLAVAPAPMLEVRNLQFRYAARADTTCLGGVSLTVAAGGRVGLFGPIGCGKSTLFNVITRLYDPPAGTVLFRGRDILSADPQVLRHEVGYALQQVHLFSASIKETLAFGMDPVPPLQALEEAARGAQILAEIEAFEHGWDTEIGERGVRLSGGQKQRLSLARLFLRKPPLLLLDDVLSAVDHSTEKRILDYIYSLGCALLIASHRGSALKRCDEVIVLDAGRVVGRGTFQQVAAAYPELARDA